MRKEDSKKEDKDKKKEAKSNKLNPKLVEFKPEMTFSTPGKFAMLPEPGGAFIIAVPEETGSAGAGKGQRVRIVRVPSKF